MNVFDAVWLAASIRLAAPLALAASGELISELSGVINVGIEGMMLSGAFFGFYIASISHSLVLGFLGAIAAGAVLAVLMVVFALLLRADQIVVGIALNVLALGLTNSLFENLFQGEQATHNVGKLNNVAIPGLSRIPVIGTALFDQVVLVYVLYLLVPAIWYALYRTRWGLEIRAAGESPEAVDAAGVSVFGRRAVGTLAAGGLGGLAGGFLSIGQLGLFVEGMSAGRGFLALAAVIFGMWRPAGVIAACLVFGAADALQLRLQAEPSVPGSVWLVLAIILLAAFAYRLVRRTGTLRKPSVAVMPALVGAGLTLAVIKPAWRFPGTLWLALPYVLALVTLAAVKGRSNAPSMLGTPYVRKSEIA